MSQPNADVMDALTGLDPGDDVTLTMVHGPEELELDGYVTDVYHEEPVSAAYGAVDPGSLSVDVELENSAVERLQEFEGEWYPTASHSVDISAKDHGHGTWADLSVVMWTPEVDDGMVISEGWTDLGELRSVEQRE